MTGTRGRPSPDYMDAGTRVWLLFMLGCIFIYVLTTPDFGDSGITVTRLRRAPSEPESDEPEGGGTNG